MPKIIRVEPAVEPKAKLADCNICPLRHKKFAGSDGPIQSRVMIIGEAPGEVETHQKRPFVGPAGRLLEWVFNALDLGLKFHETRRTNACLCRPDGNKEPSAKALAACGVRLENEIHECGPRVLVLLGTTAVKALGFNDMGRGIPEWSEKYYCYVLPIVHSSAVLRNLGFFQQFIRELSRVKMALRLNPEETVGPTETETIVFHHPDQMEAALTWVYEFIKRVRASSEKMLVSFDIESKGLDPYRYDSELLTLSFTFKAGLSVLFTGVFFENKDFVDLVNVLFREENAVFVAQDGKFDLKWLSHHAGITGRLDFDTMLAHFVTEHSRGINDLDTIAANLLEAPGWSKKFRNTLPSKESTYDLAPASALFEYAGRDTDMTWQCADKLRDHYKVNGSWVYEELLIPMSPVLQDMEARGIRIDRDYVAELDKDMSEKIEGLEADIRKETGIASFNPNSWQQVADEMYKVRKLPRHLVQNYKQSSGGTDAVHLETFVKKFDDPFCKLMLEHRKLDKVHGTYIANIEERVDSDDFMHCNFNLAGTVTGRLSSSGPNLQNIPKTADIPYDIRAMFIPRPGYVFIKADYSQAELRWLAYMSGDKDFIAIYTDTGRDLHTEVSIELFGPNFTGRDRVRAKAVNFGIPYGRSAGNLAAEHNMQAVEAQLMIDKWFVRFPRVKEWIEEIQQTALARKPVKSLLGREWLFSLVTARNRKDIKKWAVNYPIQGSASDCTQFGMLNLDRALARTGWGHLLLNVHDEVLVEAREEYADETVELIEEVMTVTPPMVNMPFPYLIEAEIAEKWG